MHGAVVDRRVSLTFQVIIRFEGLSGLHEISIPNCLAISMQLDAKRRKHLRNDRKKKHLGILLTKV